MTRSAGNPRSITPPTFSNTPSAKACILKGKVDQLLRDRGTRSGQARTRADLQLPPGQSIQARLFQVEVHPEMITRGFFDAPRAQGRPYTSIRELQG